MSAGFALVLGVLVGFAIGAWVAYDYVMARTEEWIEDHVAKEHT